MFTGSRRNIANLLPDPHFEFIRHDVTFPLYVEVDEICNLACPASPIHYQRDPVQTTKTSVHLARPMRADQRVWTSGDIARIEGETRECAQSMPITLRKTGTR
jgi:hypothetical protein